MLLIGLPIIKSNYDDALLEAEKIKLFYLFYSMSSYK